MRKAYVGSLWLLTFAFFLRVLGQALVAFLEVDLLPPIAQWYSGLLPYPLLLPIQLVILGLQAKLNVDIQRGTGFFGARRPKVGRFLRWFSYVYFFSMVLRYVLTMSLHPERRWLGGTIPIFFHCVLAAYLFLVSLYYDPRTTSPGT
jgi:hypothetical protein